MPEMHSSVPSAAAMPVVFETLLRPEDCDYPLGCECADPALQIERWSLEARGVDSDTA